MRQKILIGCPQWSHTQWQHVFFPSSLAKTQALSFYSQHYSSVEGNTTFYALPKAEMVRNWSQQAAEHFKFCFKLPAQITHQKLLQNCQADMQQFIELLSPLIEKRQLGKLLIQLPPYFSAQYLPQLARFIESYHQQVDLAVEVRHPNFFAKDENEKQLNQLLMQYQIDRIMMDTRPVHAERPSTEAIRDAQQKKPKVPVHLISTGNNPIVRYVGQTDIQANLPYIKVWLKYFKNWLEQDKQPYLFIHTADNAGVHQLTALWLELLTAELGYYPADNTLPKSFGIGQQDALF
ncbi:DUF72 domain-containing protein [Catenovulum sediminis]|uniref:DUF72 domain-containing protein n=1 Tax=Catenovulum sediminis TaxID=1740262 RepID=A0ABV1RFF2_9ALTE